MIGRSIVLSALLTGAAAHAAPFSCPQKGGDLVFGQEANVNSLDQQASNTISTRNVAMNIFEALLTRSEDNQTIGDLADSWTESPDKLAYTFKLRTGIHFHNGKEIDLRRRCRLVSSATANWGWSGPTSPMSTIGTRRTRPPSSST